MVKFPTNHIGQTNNQSILANVIGWKHNQFEMVNLTNIIGRYVSNQYIG